MEVLEKVQKMYEALLNLGAKDIEVLDISKKSKDIKYLIISSLNEEDAVKEISIKFIDHMKNLNVSLNHKDGLTKGQWVVLDFEDILVEIFVDALREKYNLEKLWKDGKNKIVFEGENVSSSKAEKKSKKEAKHK